MPHYCVAVGCSNTQGKCSIGHVRVVLSCGVSCSHVVV